jgi:DNA-binding CsgD family transcriptional regulator
LIAPMSKVVGVKQAGSAPSPKHSWDSLTPAELKVVALVAEGLTNKQIAGALHLSRFTVETHLKHVFSKLGLSSRAALAAHTARRTMQRTEY